MVDSASAKTSNFLAAMGWWRIVLLLVIVVTRLGWDTWEFNHGMYFAVPVAALYFIAPVVACVDAVAAAMDRRRRAITTPLLLWRLGWAAAVVGNLALSFIA